MANRTGGFPSMRTVFGRNSRGERGKWNVYDSGRRVFVPSRRESITPLPASSQTSVGAASSAPSLSSYELAPGQFDAMARTDPRFVASEGAAARGASSGIANVLNNARTALLNYGFTPEQVARMQQNVGQNDPLTGKPVQTFGGDARIDYDAVDASNPFSRAGLLMKSYKSSRNAITSSMASAGQGMSGAAMRAQARNDYNRNQSQDAISRDVIGLLGNTKSGVLGALSGYETARAQLLGNVNLPSVESVSASGAIPSQGRFLVGNDAAGQRLMGKGVKLGNGWRIEFVNGKPVRFIPPGGK